MKILKAIFNFFRPRSIKELEHDWLAESENLVELERRQKQLINPNLKARFKLNKRTGERVRLNFTGAK